MQSSSGTPGSSLTPSPSSNGVSEAHFVGCAEVERKYLSMMIQVEAARIATRAADSFLSDDRFANGKFRQHFQSQYPAHRKAVMAWYRRFLQQLPLTEPVAFQLQCHGAENQCYEDIYAVTDFTRKTVILCPHFWNELPIRPPKRPPFAIDPFNPPSPGRSILSEPKYVILMLLLEINRPKRLQGPRSLFQFRISDPGNLGFILPQRPPWQAIESVWNMVHFARGIEDNDPVQNLRPLAPYGDPEGAEVVKNEYIVRLKQSNDLRAHFDWIGLDLELRNYRFRRLDSINGYQAHLSRELVHGLIRFDPHVARVDRSVRLLPGPRGGSHLPEGKERIAH